LSAALRALSCREVSWLALRLERGPFPLGADLTSWLGGAPDAAEPLRALLDALPRAAPVQRDAFEDALRRACAPIQPRVAAVHDLHVRSCLYDWSPQARPDPALYGWLARGAYPRDAPADAESQQRLRRCVLRFPLGPTHLVHAAPHPACVPQPPLHPGDLCLLPLGQLSALCVHLGAFALAATFHAPHPEHAIEAILSASAPHLHAPLRAAFAEVTGMDAALHAPMRALSRALILSAKHHPSGIDALLQHIGAGLLGVAFCGRFDQEAQLLALRLSPSFSQLFTLHLCRAPRLPAALRARLRALCMARAQAVAVEAAASALDSVSP
jgi:hypothetical protein